MLTIQPKDDSFCTIKCKAKHNRKRHAVEWWNLGRLSLEICR